MSMSLPSRKIELVEQPLGASHSNYQADAAPPTVHQECNLVEVLHFFQLLHKDVPELYLSL